MTQSTPVTPVAETTKASAQAVPTSPVSDPTNVTPPSAETNTKLQADFQQLKTDLQAITAKSSVTLGQLSTLRADMMAFQKASSSAPSEAARTALQTDLKALNGRLPTDAQKAQLVADFNALARSQGVTDQTMIDKVVSDFEGIVAASNVTADDLAKIAADKAAIAADSGQTTTATDANADPNSGFPLDLILGGPGFGLGVGGFRPGAQAGPDGWGGFGGPGMGGGAKGIGVGMRHGMRLMGGPSAELQGPNSAMAVTHSQGGPRGGPQGDFGGGAGGPSGPIGWL